MEVRNVGPAGNGARPDRVGKGNPQRGNESSAAGRLSAEDFFENSGVIGRVRALVDSLVQTPEVRQEEVARARELLQSGGLDTHEAATRAAEGLLTESAE